MEKFNSHALLPGVLGEGSASAVECRPCLHRGQSGRRDRGSAANRAGATGSRECLDCSSSRVVPPSPPLSPTPSLPPPHRAAETQARACQGPSKHNLPAAYHTRTSRRLPAHRDEPLGAPLQPRLCPCPVQTASLPAMAPSRCGRDRLRGLDVALHSRRRRYCHDGEGYCCYYR